MQHKDNIDLLNSVVRATEMGKNTLDQMIPMAEKPEFKAELLKEQRGFRSFNQKAHAALDACGARAEAAPSIRKRTQIACACPAAGAARLTQGCMLYGCLQPVLSNCVTRRLFGHPDCSRQPQNAPALVERLGFFLHLLTNRVIMRHNMSDPKP